MSRKRKYTVTRIRLNPVMIENWRAAKEMNQAAAAAHCGMAVVTYRRCERGQPIQAQTAGRLAKKMGSTLSELRLS